MGLGGGRGSFGGSSETFHDVKAEVGEPLMVAEGGSKGIVAVTPSMVVTVEEGSAFCLLRPTRSVYTRRSLRRVIFGECEGLLGLFLKVIHCYENTNIINK